MPYYCDLDIFNVFVGKCHNMMQMYSFEGFVGLVHIVVMQIHFKCLLVKCLIMIQIYRSL